MSTRILAQAPATDSRPGAAADAGDPAFRSAFLMAVAATSITIGIIWDISWHSTIGRDTFWTPAHMAVYFGGILAGGVGGWLVIRHTFFPAPREAAESVRVFGWRAPLGAFVAIWGAVAMLTSAPFDNWWHNAYGLDVRIVSPPHTLLGLGMLGITLAALLLVLARQNRGEEGFGAGLFLYAGGIFLTLGSVFLDEYSIPNLQHGETFYRACAMMYPLRLVALSRAGRISWPATRIAAVYIAITCCMIWILPLFPAHPKLAPIFNPVTHMVPPAFPVLLIFPAAAMDLILRRTDGSGSAWRRIGLALCLGAAFLAVFIGVQWFFAEFLLSPAADNAFFAGNRYWTYQSHVGPRYAQFWHLNARAPNADLLTFQSLLVIWILAAGSAWLGLLLGGWMKRVKR